MATTSITSGSSAFWQQSQQALRAADQATQRAQDLRAQARDARAAADRAENDARSLETKAGQAQSAAAQAGLSVQNSASFATMQSSSADVYSVVPKAIAQGNQLPAHIPSANPSVVAQALGGVINTTA